MNPRRCIRSAARWLGGGVALAAAWYATYGGITCIDTDTRHTQPAAKTPIRCSTGSFRRTGQIWTLVVPKSGGLPDLFTAGEAVRLLEEGGLRLNTFGYQSERARIVLAAVGGYQLREVARASRRLSEREVPHTLIYLLEPGRFRSPRSAAKEAQAASPSTVAGLFPERAEARLFVTHTRPEPFRGALDPVAGGTGTRVLGFLNRGGTLSIEGLLFVNRCSWAHCLRQAGRLLDIRDEELLTDAEIAALDGRASPHGLIVPELEG